MGLTIEQLHYQGKLCSAGIPEDKLSFNFKQKTCLQECVQ